MSLSVLVPWRPSTDGYRNRSFAWLRHRYHQLLPDAQLVIGTSSAERFNRSEARNNAFNYSDGDVVLIADADTIFHAQSIRLAVMVAATGAAHWVIPYGEKRYYNLSHRRTEEILALDPAADIPEPTDEDDWEHKLTSWAGLLVVTRAAYQEAGGYDERFAGWGYEDNAFRAALDHRVGPHSRLDGHCEHLWHPVAVGECFDNPDIEANRKLYQKYELGILP